MFAFVPVSATSEINAVQMLVTLSRASHEARLYTDSKAVLFEAAIKPGQGMSAVELIDGANREQASRQAREIEEVDLHAGARKRSRTAEEHAHINAIERNRQPQPAATQEMEISL